MSKPSSLSRTLLVTAIVALGIAAFWFMVESWAQQTLQQAFQDPAPYENIYTTITGEPVLVRTSGGNTQDTEQILSLSGEPLKLTSQDLLHLSQLTAQDDSRFASHTGNWQWQIAGVNDGGVPATYWYIVDDGERPSRAYGVGFHASTRTVSGYFSRRGFTDSPPPRDDWFEVPSNNGLYGMLTVHNFGQEPRWTTGKPYFLWLADGKLWKVDLAKKQITELLDCPRAFRLSTVYRLLAQPQKPADDSASYSASSITPSDGIVREPDGLVVINQQTGESRRYPLPPDLRDQILSTVVLPNGQLLLAAQREWNSTDLTTAYLDTAGELTKQQIVRIQSRHQSPSWAWFGWHNALAAPVPLATATFALFIGPQLAIHEGDAKNAAQGIALTFRKTWPSMLAVISLSIALSILAYRRHRRFGLPNPAAWAIFSFIFGLPGWLAYRFHRTWPVLEDCPSCRQSSPRDRVNCLDCGKPFPPPPLKGIEVFA